MNQEELKSLREKLPSGYRNKLVEITGYSISSIDATLYGRLMNIKILEAAVVLAAQHQESINELSKKIQQL